MTIMEPRPQKKRNKGGRPPMDPAKKKRKHGWRVAPQTLETLRALTEDLGPGVTQTLVLERSIALCRRLHAEGKLDLEEFLASGRDGR